MEVITKSKNPLPAKWLAECNLEDDSKEIQACDYIKSLSDDRLAKLYEKLVRYAENKMRFYSLECDAVDIVNSTLCRFLAGNRQGSSIFPESVLMYAIRSEIQNTARKDRRRNTTFIKEFSDVSCAGIEKDPADIFKQYSDFAHLREYLDSQSDSEVLELFDLLVAGDVEFHDSKVIASIFNTTTAKVLNIKKRFLRAIRIFFDEHIKTAPFFSAQSIGS